MNIQEVGTIHGAKERSLEYSLASPLIEQQKLMTPFIEHSADDDIERSASFKDNYEEIVKP